MRRLLVLLPLIPLILHGEETAAERFSSTIEPALRRECVGCHGQQQAMSKLDLSSREAMLTGGSRGPAVIPGNAQDSLLYRALTGNGAPQMPPGGTSKRLTSDVIEAVRKWIDEGAPWAAAKSAAGWGNYREEDLWAFRPLRTKFDHRSIDGFIDAKLAGAGLAPAARADKRTLIRRVTFDLTGLPPDPAEVDSFVKDESPDAWRRLVDRLLDSPRYGERWGRHWLDVVRYADSSGYSNDFERPNAWRYRDYVIRSFNQDKPYDRFIREQIAGDELYPGNPEALIATGFLRAGPWEHTGMSVEAITRQMFLDDVTNAVGGTFLGLTLGCARCHDHKFDPLPTRDYYRMQAIFATTEFARPKLPFLEAENTSGMQAGRERIRKLYDETQAGLKSFDDRITALLIKQLGVERVEDLPQDRLKDALRTKKLLDPEPYEHFKLYQKHGQLYKESLDRYEPRAFAVSSGPLDGFTDGGPNLRYPPLREYKAPDVHVLPGGNVQSPSEKVTPGVLELLELYAGLKSPSIPEGVSGRRSALAEWIAQPGNPLTSRVMVNRIWQYHFGRGIAADTSNLGKTGRKPTHPELLDWLASEFITSGWSVKSIHRRILLSEAYQRASFHPDMNTVSQRDPSNDLLAYFSPRRMEAEELRDSILFVSGELSLDAGGPGVFPQINEDVARQPLHRMGSLAPVYRPSAKRTERNRRTIYTFQQRSMVDPMVEVFNGPNLDLSCERRDAATIPTQAFALLNSQFTHDMALSFAVRLSREAQDPRERVERAFRLAFGRAPEPREVSAALAHVDRMTAHHRATAPPPKRPQRPVVHMITSELTGEKFQFTQQEDPEEYEHNVHPADVDATVRAWADLALVLLNANEFVYVY